MPQPSQSLNDFRWQPQPEAAAAVRELIDGFVSASPTIGRLSERLRDETGTRLGDWVDHLGLPAGDESFGRLETAGYRPAENEASWRIESGMFPPVHLCGGSARRLFLRCESVADLLIANGWTEGRSIEGSPTAAVRRARIVQEGGVELWGIERHGTNSLSLDDPEETNASTLLRHREALLLRRRDFEDAAEGFAHARSLIEAAAAELGTGRTCDLFFAGERAYWQSRNRAARVQKARQDALGLGWANHDHHTYRSSRSHFRDLIEVLERQGFHCRERFYAGQEAGWGAQVLEQPRAGVVIFADVDLSPEEVAGDFSHEPLPQRDLLGTVGLWCALHGEAFLQAGMHHLECQFDFDAAREQLAAHGVDSMKPFTDLPWLRQAFTKGEVWPVSEQRVARLVKEGRITAAQAETFRRRGALGSHLEILQRDEGYKGFNQAGINEIIRDTDPRQSQSQGA